MSPDYKTIKLAVWEVASWIGRAPRMLFEREQTDSSRLFATVENARPLCVSGKDFYWSRGYQLFRSQAAGTESRLAGWYPDTRWSDFAGQSRLARRLMRIGFHDLIELASGDLIAIVRKAIVLKPAGEKEFRVVHPIARGTRPLNLCLTPDQRIYFGEYFSNPRREEVQIYGSEDGGRSWEVAYTFPAGSVQHVHRVSWDPFRQGIWVFTGDEDSESRMVFSADRFRTVETRFAGRQQFRTVAVSFTPEGLLYGTDSPREKNFIQLLELGSGKLNRLHPLESSCFYGAQAGAWFVFSTASEQTSVNDILTCSLWCSRDLDRWNLLARWRNDSLPPQLFLYGNLILPGGTNPGPFLYSGSLGLVGRDQQMQIWRLE